MQAKHTTSRTARAWPLTRNIAAATLFIWVGTTMQSALAEGQEQTGCQNNDQGNGQNGQSNGNNQSPPRHKPPKEALDACASKSSGAQCSFTAPFGTVTGTCRAPQDKPLACAPAGGPPGGSDKAGQPPQKGNGKQ